MNLDKESSQPSFSKSWAERNGFSDWSLAILWIIIAFIGFQFTAAIVALVLLLVNKEGQLNAAEVTQSLTENLDLLFIGNTSGQILFLGLATWFFVRLHTSKLKRASILKIFIAFKHTFHAWANLYTYSCHTAYHMVSRLAERISAGTGYAE